MLPFILKRLASGVVVIAVTSFASFTLLYISGGNIARRLLGPDASPATVALKSHELGLDRPFLVQYWDWLTSALTGNLGSSWSTSELVSSALSQRLPVTLTLVIGTTLISAVAAAVLGVLAARRGGWVDAAIQILTLLGFAVPGFLVAVALVLAFAVKLHWFAATGYVDFTASPSEWLRSITLPIVALSIAAIAAVAQQVRGSVSDALGQDYVRTLRSRGLSVNRVIYRHVLRNAGGPALAVLSLQFVGLLGGVVIVEEVFALPGIGQLSVSATTQGDIPLMQGLVIASAVVVVVVNLLIELAQAALNPKVRLS